MGFMKYLFEVFSSESSDMNTIMDSAKAISHLTEIKDGVDSLLDCNQSISFLVNRLKHQSPRNTLYVLKVLLNVSDSQKGVSGLFFFSFSLPLFFFFPFFSYYHFKKQV